MNNRLGNPVLHEIREEVRRQMNDFTDDMASGACKDFAEYRYYTGVIFGLALAERELLDQDQKLTEQ